MYYADLRETTARFKELYPASEKIQEGETASSRAPVE
jgi:hypothetical protein